MTAGAATSCRTQAGAPVRQVSTADRPPLWRNSHAPAVLRHGHRLTVPAHDDPRPTVKSGGGVRPAHQPAIHAPAAPLRRHHVDDLVDSYAHGNPGAERGETELFKSFAYEELVDRDQANLDITWLREESLEDMDNLPRPGGHRPRDR